MTSTKKKIKFVTDSVCDIPVELLQKWDISVVPCYVNYDGKSFADDRVDLNREDYFNKILSMKSTPTTAAPPPAIAEEILHKAFEGADHLIALTTPAKLSGINNSFHIGARDLPQDQVTIIDSGQLCMALGWQVLIGAEVAEQTGDVQQTIDAIYRVRKNQALYAGLATMELLRRSGRVGWAVAGIGALLQIKPVVSVWEGEVSSVARIRTFNKVVDKLIELAHQHAPLDKMAVLHINNLDGAQDLKERLKDILPQDTIIADVGPTLGTHIGPGALGVATVSKNWKA